MTMGKKTIKPDPKKPGSKKITPKKGAPVNIGKNIAFWMVLFILTMALYNLFSSERKEIEKITYSQFFEAMERGGIKSVVKTENDITGQFQDGKRFRTYISDPNLLRLLEEKYKFSDSDEKSGTQRSIWANLLISTLPFVLFILFLWFVFYRQVQMGGNRAFSFGKSKAKLVSEDKPRTTFKDVAGIDEAKEELQEIISFLKDPKKFQKLGAKIPKGVLLYGPPGCGKTLIARAVAGEAGVSFFSISGSDFVEMFVGVGASRVRDLFEQSQRHAPAIIFIDEIDAVGRQRFAGIGGGHDEREQTLNQLLAEMDGFDTKEGVILIAATNRPDVLDAALLRPGRFDRQIEVYPPDLKGREEIIRVHSKNVVLSKEVDIMTIARRTPGFSGADLANLVNEAALLAARRNKTQITPQEFEAASERVIAGPERKSRVISEYEKRIVAYHEAGHALLALLIPETDPLHKVSIIPRGGMALGYTLQLPIEDRYLVTKKELLGRMVVFLGGRIAEEIVFNESTTGGQNDLEMVSQVARRMVCEFGMSEKLGPITFHEKPNKVFLGRDIVKEKAYSEKIAVDIDSEIRRMVDECYKRGKELLEQNREKLDLLSDKLIEKEIMDRIEVQELVGIKKDTNHRKMEK